MNVVAWATSFSPIPPNLSLTPASHNPWPVVLALKHQGTQPDQLSIGCDDGADNSPGVIDHLIGIFNRNLFASLGTDLVDEGFQMMNLHD